ncbi:MULTISPECIES: hypothetical protein [unclassified Sphingobium]|uniref:hypothetical protein n=1 Tax=unclassified Sphingobium TaxID=2611147 RepID=UPI001CA3C6FE|nr:MULTISPECIES: hypothetical protein [unclassified Sphingobium]MCB4862164.1 hypothetical protein [Sphingobium sp. PNB]WDA37876.1 hypothetical protein PO876_06755 [Sphingobium sp. YC-XJ3]
MSEMMKLADGCERASKVLWRWLVDGESPWDRETTLRVCGGMSRIATDLRAEEARAHLEGE